jgi:hypothetical protein
MSSKRCEVALVAVDLDGMRLTAHSTHLAPAGEDDAGQLYELFVRARELLEGAGAQTVLHWTADPAPGGAGKRASLIKSSRAEGAALAAAGALSTVIATVKVSGATVRAAGGGTTDEAVDALVARVSGVPGDEPVRRAVAAAVAWGERR